MVRCAARTAMCSERARGRPLPLLLLAATLLAARLPPAAARDASDVRGARDGDGDDDDDDSDPAPFMMVLEHEDRWQCAASLVSLRTGLTTARCARGGDGGARELWALAAALAGARGAASPSAGARRVARVALAGDGRDPADPARDLALLELEAPFGRAARAQPILMQTEPRLAATRCHAVRALPPRRASTRVRFRVCGLSVAPDARCAERLPHWAAARARLLCLAADEDDMCERDLGGGVVCGGKLSGVLSALGASRPCGDTLAAQSVARWRRFLHCAHTLRQCGRGACASECTEHRLLPPAAGDADEPAPLAASAAAATDEELATSADVATESAEPSGAPPPRPARTRAPPPPEPPAPPPPEPAAPPSRTTLVTVAFFGDEHASSPRHSQEFEPNRADFKAAQTRTPRVRLKAGEYGDNAADYAGEDAPPPPPPPPPTPTPTPRPSAAPPAPAPALQLASSEPPPRATASARRSAPPAPVLLYCVTMILGK